MGEEAPPELWCCLSTHRASPARDGKQRTESVFWRKRPAPAPFLCECLKRDSEEIRREIVRLGLRTVGEVYDRLLSGGGCRTCAPEIARLLAEIWGLEEGAT